MNSKLSLTWQDRPAKQLERLVQAARITRSVLRGAISGLRQEKICFVDIGARGGLSRSYAYLYKAGLITPIFVEPEVKAANVLREEYGDSNVLELAIGNSEDPMRPLYVTRQPGCSSLLKPSPSRHTPEQTLWMYEVEKIINVDVRNAENVFAQYNIAPEVIKLDVQGLELDILKGLGPMLKNVIAIECEVSFLSTYEKQPLFEDVFNFLVGEGFGLTHVGTFGVAGTGSCVQANAFFGNRRLNSRRSRLVEDLALCAAGGSYAA